MRTAIVLLFLLALAAVPGSLLPQRSLSQNNVTAVLHRPPDARAGAGPALPVRRLQLAVVRRGLPAAVHLADRLRAAARRSSTPARCGPPRRRRRGTCCGCPTPGSWRPPLPAAQALDVVEEELRVRRFRVVRREGELSAEKGYLKETGNLLFHLSLVALLLGPGRRQALGLRGQHPGHRGAGLLQLLPAVRHVLVRAPRRQRRPHPAVRRPRGLPRRSTRRT